MDIDIEGMSLSFLGGLGVMKQIYITCKFFH